MHLHKLILKNYRNITNVAIEPSPEFNVLWGDNAQGKTNLLESIYLLGNLRSFRSSRNEELIRHNTTSGYIAGDVSCQGVRRRLELSIEETGKTARVDGKDIKSVGIFLGLLRPVLFSPEEVSLIKGSPAGRRALLDRAVFQVNPSYLLKAQEYERCLRQRNRLLKEGRSKNEIAPWTEQLIVTGARIRFERSRFLKRFIPLLCETYEQITGGREIAGLQNAYEDGTDEENLRISMSRELERQRDRERLLGQTLSGPHRDDPLFLVNGRSLRMFGSQGQQRSYMLAFKTAQIMDLEREKGEPPVLLLDDMTGELDRQRQDFFFRFLLKRRGQVFITTTDVKSLQQEGICNARFYRVSQGNIEE